MKYKALMFLVLIAVASSGCESMGDKTKKGAGIGALTGAAIGGIVGHQSGHGWQGALIGGGAGAVGGGAIGNQMDKNTDKVNENQLTVMQIVEMAETGAPDSVIVAEIDRTKSTYVLTAETIDYLKNNGVSNVVIDYMMATTK